MSWSEGYHRPLGQACHQGLGLALPTPRPTLPDMCLGLSLRPVTTAPTLRAPVNPPARVGRDGTSAGLFFCSRRLLPAASTAQA